MNPDDPLLKILACPLDKGPLILVGAEGEQGDDGVALYNPRLRRRYPVVDGIPQLLPSSGEQVPEEVHLRLTRDLRGERPGGRDAEAPGGRSGEGPGGRDTAGPGGRSGEGPGGRDTGAPGDRSGETPSGQRPEDSPAP